MILSIGNCAESCIYKNLHALKFDFYFLFRFTDATMKDFKLAVADTFDWVNFDPSKWTKCASFG